MENITKQYMSANTFVIAIVVVGVVVSAIYFYQSYKKTAKAQLEKEEKAYSPNHCPDYWELVRRDEYPDFESPTIDSGKYEGVFGVGGLMLARIPVETAAERNEYYRSRSQDQMDAVDQDMMRENSHSTMKISNPDRQSRVTFGGTRKS